MSCTFTHNEELVLTGSQTGSICVHLLDSGNFITKLDLHRSMVTQICVNANDDVFASCSADGVVNISSLADFCMLNQIVLSRPILHMDISLNSTFLMLSCDDNNIFICALSTGTQIHCIEVSFRFLFRFVSISIRRVAFRFGPSDKRPKRASILLAFLLNSKYIGHIMIQSGLSLTDYLPDYGVFSPAIPGQVELVSLDYNCYLQIWIRTTAILLGSLTRL